MENDGTGKKGPDYTRAGITAELHVEPFIFEKLSASFSGSYLPALSGDIFQDKYLEAGLGYTIYEEKKGGNKISLEAKYIFGAQDNLGKRSKTKSQSRWQSPAEPAAGRPPFALPLDRASSAAARISEAAPEFRPTFPQPALSAVERAPCGALHHQPIARRTARSSS